MTRSLNFPPVLILLLLLFSCGKYDDSDLKDRINSLDNRVSQIERQLQSLNQDIRTINELILVLQKNLYVTDVTKGADFYDITFSDESKITIRNGKDGKDAPVISARNVNGTYFWVQSIDGEETFLQDANGDLIAANGVTPLLKVDSDGYWLVSYDNGRNYSTIFSTNGNPVKAAADTGETFFDNVFVDNGELRLILKDGTEIIIPIGDQSTLKAVNLGLSVRWSSTNLGATLPSDRGTHFLWGDPNNTGSAGQFNAPNIDNIIGTPYDMARHEWGDTWRLPTRQEQTELVTECTWTWVTINGVAGRRVTGKNGSTIFLPTTGVILPVSGPAGSTQWTWENTGYYWVGESYMSSGSRFAYNFHFDQTSYYYNSSYNTMVVSMAVRPVKN